MEVHSGMGTVTLQNLDIIDPDLYVQRGYPHEEWALLRREAPIFWYERPQVAPFWAITKHADLIEISRALQ
jgi:cholest-4-en-3-one 26-monooxygenase